MKRLILVVSAVVGVILWPNFLEATDIEAITSTNDATSGFSVRNFGGTTLMRVRGDGNVGIGTTAPDAKLQVIEGALNAIAFGIRESPTTDEIFFVPNLGTGGWNPLSQAGDVGIFFRDNNTIEGGSLVIGQWSASPKGIRIDSAGNVGIGTAAPGARLELRGNIRLSDNESNYDSGIHSTHVSGVGQRTDYGYYHGSDTFIPVISQLLGNVGIGTTSPGARLDIEGGSGWRGVRLKLNQALGAGPNSPLVMWDSTDGGAASRIFWMRQEGDYWRFKVSDTTWGNLVTIMSADIAGNVGIGTTAPGAQLHLADIYAAGGKNLLIGDDTYLTDVDVVNTLGIYGNQDSAQAHIRLGSAGPVISGVAGNVGIGTTAPGARLHIGWGDIIAGEPGDEFIFHTRSGSGNDFLQITDRDPGGDWKWGQGIILRENGNVGIGTTGPTARLHVIGSFVATGTKSFEIDHPTKPGMKLVHATLEGPEAAVFYRGKARLKNGKAVIKLPDYFEALTRKEDRTVQLTAKGTEPYLLSATEVSEGKFKVYGTKPDGEFYWEVKAVRADVEPLIVERPYQK